MYQRVGRIALFCIPICRWYSTTLLINEKLSIRPPSKPFLRVERTGTATSLPNQMYYPIFHRTLRVYPDFSLRHHGGLGSVSGSSAQRKRSSHGKATGLIHRLSELCKVFARAFVYKVPIAKTWSPRTRIKLTELRIQAWKTSSTYHNPAWKH